jgi:basic amino acid/polyamine antiporter, APA family
MTQLARKLRPTDYFALGFGAMVGVGWLVVMDDWLERGGPLGAILGFAIGGAVLLPIGYVYGQLVMAMPDAAGEIAYTARAFPRSVSFATGWIMLLAYFIVCPWEAVAIGKIVAYLFPALDSMELYRLAGKPIYLPHAAVGVGLSAFLTALNYCGIRLSATFQKCTTFGVLALFVVFVSCGAARGAPQNFLPLFTHGPLVSILLVIQIVPYFMTGFESVGKAAEEAIPGFRSRDYFRAILSAILVAIVFYTAVIAAVACVSPWPSLGTGSFATVVAFERAFRSRWIVNVILATALLSLLKVFNGNFVAASRLLFALGRRGLIARRLSSVHAKNQTPWVAVLCVGLATAAATLLGSAILVPISEVGSVASAAGWLAACAAYYRMRPGPVGRANAAVGTVVAALLVLIKVLPFVPGHFSMYEYAALAIWGTIGLALRRREA